MFRVVRILLLLVAVAITGSGTTAFLLRPNLVGEGTQRSKESSTHLSATLKPAAIPMMDSGKAFARSGELLVDLTTELGLYGGALSATGASIRNCGDSVAQAAASCRFKTGVELVSDELREGGDCLKEAVDKLKLAIEEASTDKDLALRGTLEETLDYMRKCGESLEGAGAGIMQRQSLTDIGDQLVICGTQMGMLSQQIRKIAPEKDTCKLSAQRMSYASERMLLAGTELNGTTPKPKAEGKSWLKG